MAVLQLITITDGEPTNEPEQKIFQVIKRAKEFVSQTPYGPNAIAFEFAQVRYLEAGLRGVTCCCVGSHGRKVLAWRRSYVHCRKETLP